MSNKMTNDTSLQTTKQMLDELDALMDKMLSLPVNEADDGSAFSAEVMTPPPPSATLSAKLTLLRESPMREEAAHPSLNPPHMPMPPLEMREPAPLPMPFTNEVSPASVMEKLEPMLAEIAAPEPALTTRWGYLPLVAINVTFDFATLIFGGAGAWMRTEGGRMLLGVSGVAMMLAAAGWFLKDWFGWTWSQ